MPSVGVHGGENILPGSGLSALLAGREHTVPTAQETPQCQGKKLHFFLKQDHCAEGKLNCQKEQVELDYAEHQSLPFRRGWMYWYLVLTAGFVFLY